MEWLTDVGLGLDSHQLRLDRTNTRWITAGERLRDELAVQLAGVVLGIEHIGSTSVVGLLAKPIIDIAAGITADQELPPVRERFDAAGWIYRGDAGADGGHVFVLEAKPSLRVAHVHVVEFGGEQWRKYVLLRDLLRRSPTARARYETVKQRVAAEVGDDRVAYTERKSGVVSRLLDEAIDERHAAP